MKQQYTFLLHGEHQPISRRVIASMIRNARAEDLIVLKKRDGTYHFHGLNSWTLYPAFTETELGIANYYYRKERERLAGGEGYTGD